MSDSLAVTFLRDTTNGGDPDQPSVVAGMLTEFINAATQTVDIAIYDFRLSDALGAPVVQALIAAAARGVRVRIGFDNTGQPGSNLQHFAVLQADPAPAGTRQWITDHFTGSDVHFMEIVSAPYLMHCKYVVRDAQTAGATVWTGSVNFTDDAWTLQENNIVTLESATIAAAFARDFEALWTTGSIKDTGAADTGAAFVGDAALEWDFSPGDGPAIGGALVDLVNQASTRIAIASMVLTSHPLLSALSAALRRGVPISGIYDAGLMAPIERAWQADLRDAAVLANWQMISTHLVGKHSIPYSPTSPHDFMHNKILICDDTVATGSYNFSLNAQHNAENQLRITDSTISDQYTDYVAALVEAYQ